MQSFVEHYQNEKEQLDEFTWGQLGKGIIRFGKNILGKRTVGVGVNLMTSFKKVDRSTYNFVQGVLTNSFKSSRKVTRKEKEKLYIKDVYKGEIDDSAKRLGGYENIKDQIQDISVYQTNLFGRIFTFYLLDETGNEHYYIGTNWLGDKHFKDLFGAWPTSLASRLNRLWKNQKAPLQSVMDEPSRYLSGEKYLSDDEPDEQEKEEPEIEGKEHGDKDITKFEYDTLVKMLGNGITGEKGLRYHFKDKFTRSNYSTPQGYSGYKYVDGEHTVYLIDTHDGEHAFIRFKDKDSLKWAKDVGMFDMFRTKLGKSEPMTWNKTNDLPESNKNEFSKILL